MGFLILKIMTNEQKLKRIVREANSRLKAIPFTDSIGISILKKIAKLENGGHYTIFSFTKNYGIMLGTPYERECVENSIKGETLEDALKNILITFGVDL